MAVDKAEKKAEKSKGLFTKADLDEAMESAIAKFRKTSTEGSSTLQSHDIQHVKTVKVDKQKVIPLKFNFLPLYLEKNENMETDSSPGEKKKKDDKDKSPKTPK